MIAAGARTRATQGDAMLLFQRNVVRVQLALEDAIFEIAATNTPAAIVHDRGVFDAAGFLEPTQWKILLNDAELNDRLTLSRYHLVVHMESVACGVPELYSNANNPSRLETVTEARAVEKRIVAAWSAHPNVVLIRSRPDFEEKIEEASEQIVYFAKEQLLAPRL